MCYGFTGRNIMRISLDLKWDILQEKRTVAAVAKTAAICRLFRRIFGPLLYMRSIAAFFVTAAIGRVFCGVL